MCKTENKEYIKISKSGRLYINSLDFFKRKKTKKTIIELLDSKIMRDIEQRKRSKIAK